MDVAKIPLSAVRTIEGRGGNFLARDIEMPVSERAAAAMRTDGAAF